MKLLYFTKMVAAGNDFVVINNLPQSKKGSLKALAREICDRKYGLGADGLLVLGRSRQADVEMRIFNADGSEAQMCGNGARCVAYYLGSRFKVQGSRVKILTKAGIIESEVKRDNVRIKLTDPKDLKLDIPIKINHRGLKVNFINTGVPHAVVFVEGLEKINVASLGSQIRHHKMFAPAGANADFVEVESQGRINVRTYERGVEDETLACGTGSVAAALITGVRCQVSGIGETNVYTKSGEVLKVYFEKAAGGFKNVWLEGKAQIVYRGAYYV